MTTQSKVLPHVGSDTGVSVYLDGRMKTFSNTSPLFDKVMEAVNSGDENALLALVNVKQTFAETSNGNIVVKDGNLLYKGKPLDHSIKSRIMTTLQKGFDATHLLAFLNNLMKNPSARSVAKTYIFLEKCKLPITPDGHFIAYKMIQNDWTDCYSGTIDNSVGTKPRVERNQVDEDSERTCSFGLHVCSEAYLGQYGSNSQTDRVVAVKVNPKDVVAVPSDYNNAKMRVCGYEVIRELDKDELLPEGFSADFGHDDSDDWDDVFESDDYDDTDDTDDEPVVDNSDKSLDELLDAFEDSLDDDSDLDALNDVGDSLPRKSINEPINNRTSLTRQDVIDIRNESADDWTLQKSADEHGVSPRTIGKIRRGERFADIV